MVLGFDHASPTPIKWIWQLSEYKWLNKLCFVFKHQGKKGRLKSRAQLQDSECSLQIHFKRWAPRTGRKEWSVLVGSCFLEAMSQRWPRCLLEAGRVLFFGIWNILRIRQELSGLFIRCWLVVFLLLPSVYNKRSLLCAPALQLHSDWGTGLGSTCSRPVTRVAPHPESHFALYWAILDGIIWSRLNSRVWL